MKTNTINLFAEKSQILNEFIQKFYEINYNSENLKYERKYENPIDMIEIISTLIDNNEKYQIGIWMSIDENVFINITENNLDKIIKYLLERYPNNWIKNA